MGRPLETPYPLPNKVLIPLVVIFHLAQYTDFLGRTGVNVDETWKSPGETVGFCTGLLSAFAVATSANKTDFAKHGSVAIRLGLLVGMVVDAKEASSELNASKSLRAGWSSTQTKDEMMNIIKDFPDVRQYPHITKLAPIYLLALPIPYFPFQYFKEPSLTQFDNPDLRLCRI
jgi:hypothetical protein